MSAAGCRQLHTRDRGWNCQLILSKERQTHRQVACMQMSCIATHEPIGARAQQNTERSEKRETENKCGTEKCGRQSTKSMRHYCERATSRGQEKRNRERRAGGERKTADATREDWSRAVRSDLKPTQQYNTIGQDMNRDMNKPDTHQYDEATHSARET